MSARRCLALTLVLLLALAVSTAHATTALALSNRAMTDAAALILTGRCVEVRSAWEGRTLVTLATLDVTDVLKGDAPARVTVALPGGIDATRRFPVAMTYAGAPQIMVGEDVFLFLGQDGAIGSGLTVVGFSQGKFSVVDDADAGKAVSRNLSGITLQSPAGARRGTATRVPLDEFKNEIRGYLAGR
jgi:hypothetical protein